MISALSHLRRMYLCVIFFFVLISSCTLVHPPPKSIIGSVEEYEASIVFPELYNLINKQKAFERDFYILTGIQALMQLDDGKWAIIWDARNQKVLQNPIVNKQWKLPNRIAYGSSFPDLEELVSPKNLTLGKNYEVFIGVVGLNSDSSNTVRFSINTYFYLDTDGKIANTKK